jgi:hypothetical protein
VIVEHTEMNLQNETVSTLSPKNQLVIICNLTRNSNQILKSKKMESSLSVINSYARQIEFNIDFNTKLVDNPNGSYVQHSE